MSITNPAYLFDATGVATANKVFNDQFIITTNNYKGFPYVIPTHTPFFITSLKVTKTTNGNNTVLVEGVDYYGILPFVGATRSIGLPVYGGISFTDRFSTGVVRLEYQTLGGVWLELKETVIESIMNSSSNPRITTWEQAITALSLFPNINNDWNTTSPISEEAVLSSIDNIKDAILAKSILSAQRHLSDIQNPHRTTKTQIGLGLVQNYPPATIAQALAGSSITTLITPALLKFYIDKIREGNVATPTPIASPTPTSSPAVTAAPTPAPTAAPTPAPTAAPTAAPTPAPAAIPIYFNGDGTTATITIPAGGSYTINDTLFNTLSTAISGTISITGAGITSVSTPTAISVAGNSSGVLGSTSASGSFTVPNTPGTGYGVIVFTGEGRTLQGGVVNFTVE